MFAPVTSREMRSPATTATLVAVLEPVVSVSEIVTANEVGEPFKYIVKVQDFPEAAAPGAAVTRMYRPFRFPAADITCALIFSVAFHTAPLLPAMGVYSAVPAVFKPSSDPPRNTVLTATTKF